MKRSVLIAITAALAFASPAAADHGDTNLPWTELLPPQETSSEVQPGPVPGCEDPTLECVEGVVAEMTRRWEPLDQSCDHRAVFALTYLRTTEAFLQTIRDDPAYFKGHDWVIWEDVVFASLYFKAYDAYESGGELPEAWKIAFDAAKDGQTTAGHDIFLGMNAHIQRDLPHTLATVGLRTPEGESRKPDHDKVNYILSKVLDPVEDEVAERYDSIFTTIDASPSPVDEMGALELLKSWREGAWRNAERLLNAQTDDERAQVEQSIEITAQAWAEAFRAGEIPGYGSTRDAHCAAYQRYGGPPSRVADASR